MDAAAAKTRCLRAQRAAAAQAARRWRAQKPSREPIWLQRSHPEHRPGLGCIWRGHYVLGQNRTPPLFFLVIEFIASPHFRGALCVKAGLKRLDRLGLVVSGQSLANLRQRWG